MHSNCWLEKRLSIKAVFHKKPLLIASFCLAVASGSTTRTLAEAAPPQSLGCCANVAVAMPGLLYSGSQVSLNGRTLLAAWSQWQQDTRGLKVSTGISDAGVIQLLGVELLNAKDGQKQPIQWFSTITRPFVLTSRLSGGYRYLDITQLAKLAGWQMSVDGDTLKITTPAARVVAIRQESQQTPDAPTLTKFEQGTGNKERDRIVVDLDIPTPWQITQQPVTPPPTPSGVQGGQSIPNSQAPEKPKPPLQEWALAIDAVADSNALQRFNLSPGEMQIPNTLDLRTRGEQDIFTDQKRQGGRGQGDSGSPASSVDRAATPIEAPDVVQMQVEAKQFQTIIRLALPAGLSPRVSTSPNPNRIFIDIRPDAMVERNIVWAPGLRWRQQFLPLGASRFPVVWLEINLRNPNLQLKPIWSTPTALVGIAPLLQTAQRYAAAAAINGGFFNRNNKLPLGAIRQDGQWLSSPILNRGAIAWNNLGQVKIGRLSLQETLTTSDEQRLPVLNLNSGYVQAGIARYTPQWGATYTPLSDNETVVVVQNNQIIAQISGGTAGKTAFPIPTDGYLLALRNNSAAAKALSIGTRLRQESTTIPGDFDYPQILGAGPVLVQNRQIVLDAKVEQFSDAFIQEKAARSAIGTTANGTVLVAAVHNRVGGVGPSLMEIAQLMQQLGCVDALNLDGGSSTSLYLGGQLLNRSPRTAARVHNGLGIFLKPGP